MIDFTLALAGHAWRNGWEPGPMYGDGRSWILPPPDNVHFGIYRRARVTRGKISEEDAELMRTLSWAGLYATQPPLVVTACENRLRRRVEFPALLTPAR